MKNVVSILSLGCLLLTAERANAELGVRISLPICDRSTMPGNFVVLEYPSTRSSSLYGYDRPPSCQAGYDCATFYSEWPAYAPAQTAKLDWGDDNAIFSVHDELCEDAWYFYGFGGHQGAWVPASYAAIISTALADPNTFNPPGALAHVHGFVNSPSTSTIRGQVVFAVHGNTAPLTLALQILQGSSWVDVQTVGVVGCNVDQNAYCDHQIAEISSTVPGNSDVRLELRGASGYTQLNYQGQVVSLYEATLFGTECFPDASNPGMCLQ
ncbi:MAG TPA: hypothetical protein VHB97_22570 [Polyangia bacterium]|jgi:hypothetical protein|nr:hypothetical protein [Polyangia bacterium]